MGTPESARPSGVNRSSTPVVALVIPATRTMSQLPRCGGRRVPRPRFPARCLHPVPAELHDDVGSAESLKHFPNLRCRSVMLVLVCCCIVSIQERPLIIHSSIAKSILGVVKVDGRKPSENALQEC